MPSEPHAQPVDPIPPADLDERGTPRRRTLLTGRIDATAGGDTVECLIRNLSGDGARLDTRARLDLPDRFLLTLPDGTERVAETVWTDGHETGVRFCDTDTSENGGLSLGTFLTRIDMIEDQLRDLRTQLLIRFGS